jgi:predicted nucleotidyltransferase
MPLNYQLEIEKIMKQIVEKFNPVKIILFGSLARGNYHAESDIDLLVVQDSVDDRIAVTSKYYKEIDYDIPTDFVITKPEDYSIGNSDNTNMFARTIQNEGVVLYER